MSEPGSTSCACSPLHHLYEDVWAAIEDARRAGMSGVDVARWLLDAAETLVAIDVDDLSLSEPATRDVDISDVDISDDPADRQTTLRCARDMLGIPLDRPATLSDIKAGRAAVQEGVTVLKAVAGTALRLSDEVLDVLKVFPSARATFWLLRRCARSALMNAASYTGASMHLTQGRAPAKDVEIAAISLIQSAFRCSQAVAIRLLLDCTDRDTYEWQVYVDKFTDQVAHAQKRRATKRAPRRNGSRFVSLRNDAHYANTAEER